MNTQRKTSGQDAFQTVDEGMRTSRIDMPPLRPTASRKGKPTTPCANAPTPGLTHDQIAERARAIWLQRGSVPGQDERNWYDAEAELRSELGLKQMNV